MDRAEALAACADPRTAETVLLGLPVEDDQTWLAFATCAAATPKVLDRLVHLTGAAHLNRQTELAPDIALVVRSQPRLTRLQLLEYACRLGGTVTTADLDAAVDALTEHPAAGDDVLIELYHPRIHAGEFDWSTPTIADYNRPGVQAALARRGHPLAAAMILLRYSRDLSWMGVHAGDIAATLARVRAAADAADVVERTYVHALLRLAGGQWPGTAEDLLKSVSAVLTGADHLR